MFSLFESLNFMFIFYELVFFEIYGFIFDIHFWK